MCYETKSSRKQKPADKKPVVLKAFTRPMHAVVSKRGSLIMAFETKSEAKSATLGGESIVPGMFIANTADAYSTHLAAVARSLGWNEVRGGVKNGAILEKAKNILAELGLNEVPLGQ